MNNIEKSPFTTVTVTWLPVTNYRPNRYKVQATGLDRPAKIYSTDDISMIEALRRYLLDLYPHWLNNGKWIGGDVSPTKTVFIKVEANK